MHILLRNSLKNVLLRRLVFAQTGGHKRDFRKIAEMHNLVVYDWRYAVPRLEMFERLGIIFRATSRRGHAVLHGQIATRRRAASQA